MFCTRHSKRRKKNKNMEYGDEDGFEEGDILFSKIKNIGHGDGRLISIHFSFSLGKNSNYKIHETKKMLIILIIFFKI